MPYEIKPTCPHCKKQLKENEGLRILKDIFK